MDTLLSIFVPSKIKRYKNMSAIVAIAIFAIAAYLMVLPSKLKPLKIDDLIQENVYNTQDILEFNKCENYQELQSLNLSIDEKYTLSYNDNQKHTFKFSNSSNDNLYVVIDSSINGASSFNQALDVYELVGQSKEASSFTILFASDFIFIGKCDETQNYEVIQASSYAYAFFDFEELSSPTEFLTQLTSDLALIYNKVYQSQLSLSSILMVIGLPLVLVIVMFLLFRKKSKMTTLKEYLNVAGICTIAPAILFFGLNFISHTVLNFYTIVFVFFYIFTVFKINTEKEV